MKIALLLPGYLRTYAFCYGSLRTKILDVLRPDIFVVTYDKLGFNHHDGPLREKDGTKAIADFKMMARPRKMLVQKYQWIKQDEYTKRKGQMEWCRNRDPQLAALLRRTPHAQSLQTTLAMFKNIHLANELRRQYETEAKVKYDVVIRSRADLLYDGKIDPKEVLDCVANRCLYVPPFANCEGHEGMHDQFCFGPADLMDVYCNCYNSIEKYILEDNVLIHPESLLGHHFRVHNLQWKFSKMRHVLKRGNGGVTDQRHWN